MASNNIVLAAVFMAGYDERVKHHKLVGQANETEAVLTAAMLNAASQFSIAAAIDRLTDILTKAA